jgi:hypothetical protein
MKKVSAGNVKQSKGSYRTANEMPQIPVARGGSGGKLNKDVKPGTKDPYSKRK